MGDSKYKNIGKDKPPYKEIPEVHDYEANGYHFCSVKHVACTFQPWWSLDHQLWASVCVMRKTTPARMHTQLMSEIPHRACPLRGHATRAGPVQKLSSHHTKICQVWLPSPGLPIAHAGSDTSKPDPCELSNQPFFSMRAQGKIRWGEQDLLTRHELEHGFIVWSVSSHKMC